MTQPLTDAINALTRYANETTGQSDTNLSDAVRTLCDGYGGGGVDWAGLINNEYEDEDVVYDEATFRNPIAIGLTRLHSLTLTNYVDGTSEWGRYGQWKELYLPKLTDLGLYGLRGCTRMKKVYVPKLTSVGSNFGFEGCSALENIILPSITRGITASTFANCRRLQIADLGTPTGLLSHAFQNCSLLSIVIIRKTSEVATLANTGAFSQTPFASGGTGGTLYVPQSLISSYQSANNWSTILGYANNQILPIEGSIYETHYADGTPIE